MKTLKVSDKLHAELTALVGQLIAESGKTKTYQDAVEALLHQSVAMPPEATRKIEDFVAKNKQFGYCSKEEFVREAARWLMEHLSRHEPVVGANQKTGKEGRSKLEPFSQATMNRGERSRSN
jgi:Arc/MetJ-type ribon-helix-helix transcriptional regulator